MICAEAGLSLNQAIEEISRDIRPSSREVAEELEATSAEMRVLPDVGQALDNLAERTGLDMLRSIIATLKQSMRFGTPLSESMRILAAEMRAARQARIEERAARLPVLLAIPMMLFILPCVLMVVGTPGRIAGGRHVEGLHGGVALTMMRNLSIPGPGGPISIGIRHQEV